MNEERRERVRRMEQERTESTRKDILRKHGGELLKEGLIQEDEIIEMMKEQLAALRVQQKRITGLKINDRGSPGDSALLENRFFGELSALKRDLKILGVEIDEK